MQTASFLSRFGLTLLGVLPASLFVGLMVATAGFAVHPPLAFIATPLVCSGEVEVESQSYSYRPGQSGVTRTLWCLGDDGGGTGKPAREDITGPAMLAAFAVYSAITFVPLQLLAWRLRRRAAGLFRWKGVRIPPGPGGAGAADAGGDLSAILAQVAEAVERGDARVTVRKMEVGTRDEGGPVDEGGPTDEDDPAERLVRLVRLRDEGLITLAEYQAKRAEILSRL